MRDFGGNRVRAQTIVGASPIQQVILVARHTRAEAGFTYDVTSLPGHHIQAVISGRVAVERAGCKYDLRRGAVIWFHEDEPVRGRVLEAPWTFYSVNFIAPLLPPPEEEFRLIYPPTTTTLARFKTLLEQWQDLSVPPLTRQFQVHGSLLQLLSGLTAPAQKTVRMSPGAQLWWELEREMRKDLSRPYDLKAMCQIARRGQTAIAQSCHKAVGMPPLKRIKQVRMSLARGLVWMSNFSMGEIAVRVGYARVHEFSRDYRKQFGMAPTVDREKYPRIFRREFGLPLT